MTAVLDRSQVDEMIHHLARDWDVRGPVVVDGAIRHGRIDGVDDLPSGWHDEQAPGRYRLSNDPESSELFGYAVGADSLKTHVDPPEVTLFVAERTDSGLRFRANDDAPERVAFIGARACDLAAMAVQDRVFLGGTHRDPAYAGRRETMFIVAVDCGAPAATCFCTSMGTGPRVAGSYDVAMTEVATTDGWRYVCRAGSDRGDALLAAISAEPAGLDDLAAADATIEAAVGRMTVRMDPEGVRDELAGRLDAAEWTDVADRCLACGNCTMVCPTCFCSTVVDATSLDGASWTRTRVWDSCFGLGHSSVHGHPVRASVGARYRQWITHKLSTWYDQFGTSGCVGCGRCATWCPVGIDLVAEATAGSSQEVAP